MAPSHDYDTDLASRSYRRLYAEESAIAFSAMDCVLNGEKAVYASSELTTGERAYATLRERGYRSLNELAEPHRQTLLEVNTEAAAGFARRIRLELGGRGLVISPAPFLAPGWTQAEYLAFWETLIRTRIAAVYFNERWEFSNGCTFEFAVALECGIPTFDHALRPLSHHAGMQRVDQAIVELVSREIDVDRLRLNAERIRRAPHR